MGLGTVERWQWRAALKLSGAVTGVDEFHGAVKGQEEPCGAVVECGGGFLGMVSGWGASWSSQGAMSIVGHPGAGSFM